MIDFKSLGGHTKIGRMLKVIYIPVLVVLATVFIVIGFIVALVLEIPVFIFTGKSCLATIFNEPGGW